MTMGGKVFLCCSLFILVTVCSFASSDNVTNLSNDVEDSSILATTEPAPVSQTQPFTAVYTSSVELEIGSMVLGGHVEPIVVQKCCPHNQVLRLGPYISECTESDQALNMDVFWANTTHYWNYTNTLRADVLMITTNPCNESKYYLDPNLDKNDTFHLLHNRSLYVPYSMEMMGPGHYCVDILQDASGTIASSVAVVCTPTPANSVLHYFFGTGLLLSVISLSILAIYTMWREDLFEDHKKCLAFFSGTMALSLLLIAISVFCGRYMPNLLNIIIAYIVYYLKLNYFLWLTVLCYDTWRCVRKETDDDLKNKNSFKWYMLVTYSIPVLFVLINLIDKYNPALPNLYLEFSYSSSFVWSLLLFYVPNIITVVINIYIMTSISVPKDKCRNVADFKEFIMSKNWKLAAENKTQLRNMYRRTFLLCILLLTFLLLDLVIYLLPSQGEQRPHFILRDVVYCMQGVFIACMFIRKDCCSRTLVDNAPTDVEMEKLNKSDVV